MKNSKLTNLIRKVTIFAMLVVTLMCALPGGVAHAANVCKEISGNSKNTVYFTVETGNKKLFGNKIVLKGGKGTMKYDKWLGGGQGKMKMYGYFRVYYRKAGAKNWKVSVLKGSSLTIKLDANSKYEFKVVPGTNGDMQTTLRSLLHGVLRDWTSPATWKIGKTKGVSFCR